MVKYISFLDPLRQEEINMFYDAAQMQRDFYRGYPKAYHPLTYFLDSDYLYQCPPEMTYAYLNYPAFHVKYKQPVSLPPTTARTSGFPPLPERTVAGRFNKAACMAYKR
ncbi:uncharacterized protein LOC113230800 [Hyposmocoma kahamanoa]|uniref:uncharacterized protein LOC113230800 n=1 Tax=Hyposmocoma kahamanoa TaxID=1477025 RepID=UPI000E6D8526|nr:uncharacterized protein LOC113230800 [Hyposmocoma kahamanoa]